MNKSESKYFNTALRMDEALIGLLDVKDLEYITVKEICAKAGVNRSTFYLHYETVDDLLTEATESVNRRFLSCFPQTSVGLPEKINDKHPKELVFITREYLLPFLSFVKDNKSIYRAYFRNPKSMDTDSRYNDLKKNILEPVMSRFKIPQARYKYYIAYYIEGTMAIVREWLNNNCGETVETITSIIEECVRPFAGGTEEMFYGK